MTLGVGVGEREEASEQLARGLAFIRKSEEAQAPGQVCSAGRAKFRQEKIREKLKGNN